MSDSTIHPIDWRSLEKGSSISELQILEFWEHHNPDKDFDAFSWIWVKDEITKLRAEINQPIVIKQERVEDETTFRILTDKEAPDYFCLLYTSPSPRDRG